MDIAIDGSSGKSLALSEDYDLLILDIMLPHQDGLSVLKTLRKNRLSTPVLMLTARGSVEDRVSGLDAGADDYLVKPFAVAELTARVRALLRRQSEEKSPLLGVGELLLDPSSREVKVQNEAVELTGREFAVLEYLLRNKNRLVSKGMIADHVWDYHFDSDFNLIEVYIKRIRHKIERPGSPRLIRTVRGGGYIIKDSSL